MNQSEFYALPEVIEQLNIQKNNPYGSIEHKAAHDKIGEIAKSQGIYAEYSKSGGTDY